MDPILGVAIGISMPMLFGFMLGYHMGKQAKSKEILEALSRPTQRAADVSDDRPYCSVCNGYHYPVPKEGHFKPQRG